MVRVAVPVEWMVGELNVAVAPAGRPVTPNDTSSLKPLKEPTVTV